MCSASINTDASSALSLILQRLTMTIDLSFFHRGELVVRVNMTAVYFYDKVCEEIVDDEMDAVITEDEETGDEILTDRTVIKKIWGGCLKYGYISQDHDILGLWVDKIVVR